MTGEGFRDKFDPGKRLTELRRGGEPADTTPSGESADDEGAPEAFSLLSADRQQKVMLEFRFKDGNARALPYSYLVSLDFDPSNGIGMDFSGYEVRVAGRNLEPLFTGLVSQRVAVVREVDPLHAAASADEDSTVVTHIAITPRE